MPSAKTSVPIEYGGRDKKMKMLVDATNKNTEDILHPYVAFGIPQPDRGDAYAGDILIHANTNFDIGISNPSNQYTLDWYDQESSNIRSNKEHEDYIEYTYEVDLNYYNFNLYAKNNTYIHGMGECRPSIGYGIYGLTKGEIYKFQFTVTINDASRISSSLSDMFGVYFGEYMWMDEEYTDIHGHTKYRPLVIHSSDNPGNWDPEIGFLSFHRDREGIPVDYEVYSRDPDHIVFSLQAILEKMGYGLGDYSNVVSITNFKLSSVPQTKYKSGNIFVCGAGYDNYEIPGEGNADSWIKLSNPGSDIYDGIETPSINLGHDGDLYVQYSKSVLDNISISKSEEVIFSGTTPVKSSSKYAFEVYGTNEAEDEPWNPHTNLKKNKVSYVDYSITGLTPRKRYYIEGTMAAKAGSVVWYENDGSPWTVDYNPEQVVIEISDPVNTLTPYKIEQNTLTYRYYVTYNESYDFNFEFVPSGTSMTFRIYTEGFSRAEGVVSGFNVTDFRSIGYTNAKIYAKIKGDWIEVVSGGGGGSSDSITPVLTSGTKIADFDIGGNTGSLYAPSGGGGGSTVVIDPVLFQDGTPIATYSINGVQGTIYIPDIPVVEANPSSNPSQTLTKLSIDDVVYDIPGEETEYVPLIPAMTSSSDPSGTVTDSSDIGGSYVAWKAFDDDTATGWVGSSSDYTPWIQYDWDSPQVFHKLYLDLYNPDTTTTLTRTLTIQGLLSDGTYENCLLSGNSLAVEFKKNAHTKYEVHLNGQSYEAIKITSSDRSYLGENSPECRFCEIQVYQNLLPKGTVVIANPSGQATEDLTKIQIGTDIYNIVGGGGSGSGTLSETILYVNQTGEYSTTVTLSDTIDHFDMIAFYYGVESEYEYSPYITDYKIVTVEDLNAAHTDGKLIILTGWSTRVVYIDVDGDQLTMSNEYENKLLMVKGISLPKGGGGSNYTETSLYTGTTPSTTVSLSDSFLNYDALLFTTGFDYSVYTYLVSTIISKTDLQTALTNGYMVTMGYSANNYCFGIPTANNEFTDCYSDGYLFSVKGIKYGSGGGTGGSSNQYGYEPPDVQIIGNDGDLYFLLDANDKESGKFLYMVNQWKLISGCGITASMLYAFNQKAYATGPTTYTSDKSCVAFCFNINIDNNTTNYAAASSISSTGTELASNQYSVQRTNTDRNHVISASLCELEQSDTVTFTNTSNGSYTTQLHAVISSFIFNNSMNRLVKFDISSKADGNMGVTKTISVNSGTYVAVCYETSGYNDSTMECGITATNDNNKVLSAFDSGIFAAKFMIIEATSSESITFTWANKVNYVSRGYAIYQLRHYDPTSELVLYDNGTENVQFTKSSNNVTKNEDNISISLGSGNYRDWAMTQDPIDVTDYSTIHVTCFYRDETIDQDYDISSYNGYKYLSFTYLTDNSHNEISIGLTDTNSEGGNQIEMYRKNGGTSQARLYYMSLN